MVPRRMDLRIKTTIKNHPCTLQVEDSSAYYKSIVSPLTCVIGKTGPTIEKISPDNMYWISGRLTNTVNYIDTYDNQIKFVDADNVEHGFIRLKSNNDSERYDLNIASNIVVTSIIRATPDMYSWWFAHTYVTNRCVVVNRDGELCKYK